MKTYNGSCHCGKIKFEVTADIQSLRSCNCSVCTMRGALIFRVEEDCLTLKTPLEDNSLYQWKTMTAKDYFCPVCGILPFRRPSSLTEKELSKGMVPFGGWAINARCIENLDLNSILVIKINGQELD